jgi:hypothetical protein
MAPTGALLPVELMLGSNRRPAPRAAEPGRSARCEATEGIDRFRDHGKPLSQMLRGQGVSDVVAHGTNQR